MNWDRVKGESPMNLRETASPGQIIVLFALAVAAVLVMVAVIVDGGNLWSQQRIVQNGSDSSAEGGAVVLAERLAGAAAPGGGWDAAIAAQVAANAAANGISVEAAYYTDICGIPLTPLGAKATNPDGTENLAIAAKVGSGFPTSSATTPDCPSLTVGPPAGVLVIGHKDVQTYLAGLAGFAQVGVTTRATAVSGYLQGYCDASQGEACAILPVTIPVNVATCAGNGDLVTTGDPWALGVVYKIPLCGNSPGNVGWLDWTPPNGGINETVCSILHPDNPAIDLPSWQFVTATGNSNGGGGQCHSSVEDAIRTYNGQVVLIPQFDRTCQRTPDQSQVSQPPNYGCPGGQGTGQELWYRFPSFAFLQLCSPADSDCVAAGATQGAYIQGNNRAECEVGGNGATSCLVGKFVKVLASGTVGPGVGGGVGGEKVVGIQLIK
jgi:hypothetical protein